ncbi:ADP-glyceromanno-heptose 6-epimerase [bacterium]|nr:ADP-glyceromanno-heptose 6-epimerase [bacterium]
MVVVTGGAGFIGSCFVWKLNQMGVDDVIIVDHLGTGEKWQNLVHRTFADYLDKDEFLPRLERGDFNETVDAIVHAGACSATTERDADYLMANNVQYSKALASWAVAHGKRFLYASSAATYGGGECGYSDDDAVTPRLRPLNMYGYSKQLFDLWVLRNGYHDRVTGFKYFNVFGPNEYHKGDMRSVIHKAYPVARDEGVMRLFTSLDPRYADGGQMRDFVYVKDVVEVMAFFWQHPDKTGIYNIGTGTARPWNDVARALFRAIGVDGRIEYTPLPGHLRDKYQYFTEADLAKLRRAGCAHAFMSLEDSIADYVRNHLVKGDPYL